MAPTSLEAPPHTPDAINLDFASASSSLHRDYARVILTRTRPATRHAPPSPSSNDWLPDWSNPEEPAAVVLDHNVTLLTQRAVPHITWHFLPDPLLLQASGAITSSLQATYDHTRQLVHPHSPTSHSSSSLVGEANTWNERLDIALHHAISERLRKHWGWDRTVTISGRCHFCAFGPNSDQAWSGPNLVDLRWKTPSNQEHSQRPREASKCVRQTSVIWSMTGARFISMMCAPFL